MNNTPAVASARIKARYVQLVTAGKVKLSRGLDTLMRSHPFHGHIANAWRARPELPNRRELAVGTMGVCWSGGAVLLVWNPEFVNSISELQLAGVLLHEVHHVVLRHPFMFPDRDSPEFDGYAAIVAEEVTVNEFVTLPLPGKPLRLEQFQAKYPSLRPFESTRGRYRKLYNAARAKRDHEQRQQLLKSLEEQIAEILSAEGLGDLADSHAGWGSFKDGGAAAALAIAVATSEALRHHGHTLSPALRDLLQDIYAGSSAGTMPGGALEMLAGTACARIPWQKILRRLLAVNHESEPTFSRPSRRFPDLVGVLPGSRRIPVRRKLLAAIDTSGSMSSDTLDEIAAELRVMAKSYEVAVVEFDAAIQRQYRLGRFGASAGDQLTTMQGRGGTSFLPVFTRETLDWAATGGELSAVLVFTDGYGPAPERPPREPVYWILMGEGVRRPASWGTVVPAATAGRGPMPSHQPDPAIPF